MLCLTGLVSGPGPRLGWTLEGFHVPCPACSLEPHPGQCPLDTQAGIILLPAPLNSSASPEEPEDDSCDLSLKPHLCEAFCFTSWPFLAGESVFLCL